jgi:DNA-binding transcriptional regulator/RsmH inhibitor MraZ
MRIGQGRGDKAGHSDRWQELKQIPNRKPKKLEASEKDKLRKALFMHLQYVAIDKHGRIFSIPKKWREVGFQGRAEAIGCKGAFTIFNPTATLEQIERSLDIQLREVGRRLGHRPDSLIAQIMKKWRQQREENEVLDKKYHELLHRYNELKRSK